jgi:hypothetical protein
MRATSMKTTKPRRYSRVRALGPEPRLEAIQEAARACDASGRARAHVMAGDYAWPRHYVASLDELKLFSVPAAQIIAYGFAFLDAAIVTALDGKTFDETTLGQLLGLEAVAEGEANQATAALIDAPTCDTRRRVLLQAITKHMAQAYAVRQALLVGAQ